MVQRLLIIDDEPQFAQFVRNVGEGMGFEVRAESSARKFKEAYLSDGADILVLDIVMPEVDGFDLLRWLVAQGCHSRVILMTGYNPNYATNAKTIAEVQSSMNITVIQKPIKLALLRAALEGNTHI